MKIIILSLLLTNCVTPFIMKKVEVKRYDCVKSLISRGIDAEKAYKICTNLFNEDVEWRKYR